MNTQYLRTKNRGQGDQPLCMQKHGVQSKKCPLLLDLSKCSEIKAFVSGLRSHQHSPMIMCVYYLYRHIWLNKEVQLWVGDLVAGEAEEIPKSYFLGSWKFLAEFSKYILTFKG